MANRRKQYADYVKEATRQITLSVPISLYQLLEQFTEGTNRPMVEVISQVFIDTTIVSIRHMLAANATPGKKERYASIAPAKTDEPVAPALPDPAAARLPPPVIPPFNPPTPVADHAVPGVKQPPQERPPLAEAPQSLRQSPAVPQPIPPLNRSEPLPSTPPRPVIPPSARPSSGDAERSESAADSTSKTRGAND